LRERKWNQKENGRKSKLKTRHVSKHHTPREKQKKMAKRRKKKKKNEVSGKEDRKASTRMSDQRS